MTGLMRCRRTTSRAYVGTVRVLSITDANRAFVEWSLTWTDSHGGVAEFCDPIYRALLDRLKVHFA